MASSQPIVKQVKIIFLVPQLMIKGELRIEKV